MARVLALFEHPSLGGGERSLLAAWDALGADWRWMAAAPPAGPLAEALRQRGVPVLPFSLRDAAGRRQPLDAARRELARWIRRARPDLVHANSLAMSRLAGPVAAEWGGPSIGHVRDIVRLSRQAVRDVSRHGRLLAVSRAAAAWHAAQGVPRTKLHVAYNGVDVTEFRPRPPTGWLGRRLGAPADAVLIGGAGQICLRKGWDLFVAAAEAAASEAPRAHFVLVGRRYSDKPETVALENRLRAAAAAGPLAGRLHLLGWRPDMPRILNELTALVHPARQEPLGRVLLEAAASGLPIAAARVGGTEEIFPGGEAALLVPPDDPESLAAAAARLANDPQLRRRLSVRARQRAVSHFSAARAARVLERHYRESLEGRAAET